jgi:hypothetical protein
MSQGLIPEVAVGGCVDFNDEAREEYIHPKAVHANVPTSTLALMCT